MQTAIAPAPRSAREAFQSAPTVNPAPNLDAPRFFVQFAWDVFQVDTDCIPNKYLLRGEITPLRSFPKKSNIFEISEAARIPGSEEADPSPDAGDRRRVVWAKYWLHAQSEAQRLIDLERGADLQMGLFEITALARAPHLYEQLDFNAVFYPGGLHSLPQTNVEMVAYLRNSADAATEKAPSDLKGIIAEIGEQLIEAAEYADRAQLARVEFSHSCMKLTPDDKSGFYKKKYDILDEESLLRTGKPRIHQAIDATAEALKMLAGRDAAPAAQDNAVLIQLLTAQQEQNAILRAQAERQDKVLELLLAERQETKSAGKTEPKIKKNDGNQ